jgi:hypothetical protein
MPGVVHARDLTIFDAAWVNYAKQPELLRRNGTGATQTIVPIAGGGARESLAGTNNNNFHLFAAPMVDLRQADGQDGSAKYRFRHNEGATDDASLFFGLSSGAQTGGEAVITNAKAMAGSQTHIGFHKPTDTLRLDTICVSGSTANRGSTDVAPGAYASEEWVDLEIRWVGQKFTAGGNNGANSGVGFNVSFYVNGELVDTVENFPLTGLALVFACAAGKSAGAAEVTDIVDFTLGNKHNAPA